MRPRERMLAQGRGAMEDAKLLAMLIGSGTTENSAVGLCRRILASVDCNLRRLARLSLEELYRFRGIGMARGLAIMAAAELSVRMLNASRSFALEEKIRRHSVRNGSIRVIGLFRALVIQHLFQ